MRRSEEKAIIMGGTAVEMDTNGNRVEFYIDGSGMKQHFPSIQ
ncbi:MAG: hypothetical protein U9O96_07160 [Candidatus Thermoplasmatota archaeon]|nr:hypothetical protein [Candidatus Thermoplasmatota archaeon]